MMSANPQAQPVVFVGAGPGDPDLITRKGWRLLGQADVILYDALLDVQGFRQAAPSARWINVGKRVGQISTAQSFITRTLVNLARRGYRVVRLKGGDPTVFGRLTEEIDACRYADIDVEIIPGVTAASSCAAELGISLTKRQISRSVTFLTPRVSGGGIHSDHWIAPALQSDTVVFYMASEEISKIAKTLLLHGKNPHTPLAFVESASRGAKKTVTTLIQSSESLSLGHGGPVTVLMGEVVRSATDSYGQPSYEAFLEANV